MIGTNGMCEILDDVVYKIEDQFVASKQAIRYLFPIRIYAKLWCSNFENEHFKPTENTDKVLPETLLGFASVTLLCLLTKKKLNFPHILGNSEGIGFKVTYD